MSTPDEGAPGELRLLAAQVPLAEIPPRSPLAASPGVTSSVARHPGAPPALEGDPAGFALVVARLANDLFQAPTRGDTPPWSTGAPGATNPEVAAAGAPAPAAPAGSGNLAHPTTADAPDRARAGPSAPGAPAYRVPSEGSLPGASAHGVPLGGAPSETHVLERLARAIVGADAAHAFRAPLVDAPTPSNAAPETASRARPAGASPRDVPLAPVEPADTSAANAPRIPTSALLFEPVLAPALQPRPEAFDARAVRREFPILEERVHGKRLVWLDNAATTQKPRAVIDRLTTFYERENSNVHRAAHTLAARATDAYEAARESVRRFLGAPSARDVVFVRGATEGINLVAQSWGRRNVREGDEIVISWLEHHANIVPWQQLAASTGARLRVAPVDDRGQIDLDAYERLLGPRTRLVAFSQVSNALGTVTPARAMVEMAQRHGATVLVDGAQAVSHMRVDVQALGADFYVFSGHKVFGPTGIGAVYGKGAILDRTPPWQGGGNMIQDVTFERTVYQAAPARFEAGTGNIADAVGLGAALDWLGRVGLEAVERHEHELLAYATGALAEVPGLTMVGTAAEKAGVLSFVLRGQRTEEVGGILDRDGIAVRSGHHCAQPILRRFGHEATVRASLALYNTCEDVDALVDALRRLQSGQPRTR